ncbi:1-aminocyclopropane-1-carboxylate deaminase/D-cysteine desulfhydrase [Flavobacterium sp.]|uniref:1-aminocyclopropane-1-carboxylate deaminase/D-cysteine desulfhydrase n=1 Tax=Flavobacterium sp. TaxID=239 RepID=UPI00261322DB|nr:pyridoxal-phosphate dependent enzyme [Flavobacterium sp.]
MQVLTQEIHLNATTVKLFIKREDLIHPFVSGNKFRKLKYNLLEAKKLNKTSLVTFGGAYSNHIAAVAFAGKQNGFKTVGIIRGEELESKISENPTLQFCQDNGMKFVFVSREQYRLKETERFLDNLKKEFENSYIIPEGGTNDLAIKGCEEILNQDDDFYNFVCCSIGTGGTISGLINNSFKNQKILGFPALKGDFIKKDICKFAKNENWELISDYHFGGYGKVTAELIDFINDFYQKNAIPLDPIYTGKMVFGVIDLIYKNYFPENSKILLIHTGGLQGIQGMNIKLNSKKMQTINFDD